MTLDAFLTFAMLAAFVGAWWLGWLPQHFTARPLWMAFTATVAAPAFLVAGLIGYDLSGRSRFLHHTAWSQTIIFWEVAAGVAFALVAAFLWRWFLLQGSSTGTPLRAKG